MVPLYPDRHTEPRSAPPLSSATANPAIKPNLDPSIDGSDPAKQASTRWALMRHFRSERTNRKPPTAGRSRWHRQLVGSGQPDWPEGGRAGLLFAAIVLGLIAPFGCEPSAVSVALAAMT